MVNQQSGNANLLLSLYSVYLLLAAALAAYYNVLVVACAPNVEFDIPVVMSMFCLLFT